MPRYVKVTGSNLSIRSYSFSSLEKGGVKVSHLASTHDPIILPPHHAAFGISEKWYITIPWNYFSFLDGGDLGTVY
jgi:hypothetical protein